MDESIDIEALKKDEQFLADVKMLEEEVKNSDSVAKAYQLLDVKLALNEDEEGINELFQKIVNGAFTNIAIAIENGKKLDISNAEDFATMRGIYEYAMQAFSENLTKQAQELFLALHHVVDDFELKDAINKAKELYQKYNVKVLPGEFLGRDGEGKDFWRLALVYEPKVIEDALNRIKEFLKNG